MADARLRSLERRVSQGDPEAEPQLLLERVRLGLLARERLELAAALGHAAAARALERTIEREDPDSREWLWNLLPHGRWVVARAILIAARYVLPSFESVWPDELAPRDALEAVEAACDAGAAEALVNADGLLAAAGHALRAAEVGASIDATGSIAAFAAYHAARTAWVCQREEAGVKEFLHQVANALNSVLSAGAQETDLREAIRAELLAWSLDDLGLGT